MLDDTAIFHKGHREINDTGGGPSDERRRSPVMVLIWVSVIVSHLTLAGLLWSAISSSRESGYQNRALEDLTTKTNEIKADTQLWQAYVISLQKKMIENGIEVPEAPKPVK
jgi:hypothetical protein